MKFLSSLFFAAALAAGQYQPTDSQIAKRQYRWSLIAVAAGTGMDIASSWDRPEANGLLRSPDGRFGHRGVALKVSLIGSFLAIESLVLHRRPDMTRFASRVNYGIGAGTGIIAIRNWSH